MSVMATAMRTALVKLYRRSLTRMIRITESDDDEEFYDDEVDEEEC